MCVCILVTPCVGVWIETYSFTLNSLSDWLSHPAWVCGLKPEKIEDPVEKEESHPAWVCGLKRNGHIKANMIAQSHPAWVCGLKPLLQKDKLDEWLSHPAWVCGLKLLFRLKL